MTILRLYLQQLVLESLYVVFISIAEYLTRPLSVGSLVSSEFL